MDINAVGLTVTDPFIPCELLVAKFTENDQVKVSINLWDSIRAKLQLKPIYTILKKVDGSLLVEGVKNFYFLRNIFDVMLDFIQTWLLDMLDLDILLLLL